MIAKPRINVVTGLAPCYLFEVFLAAHRINAHWHEERAWRSESRTRKGSRETSAGISNRHFPSEESARADSSSNEGLAVGVEKRSEDFVAASLCFMVFSLVLTTDSRDT